MKFATASRDGTIKIWNALSLSVELTIKVGQPKKGQGVGGKFWINSIAYMKKSKKLAAACADRTIKFYDLDGTQPDIAVSAISELDGMPLCIEYSYTESRIKSTDP